MRPTRATITAETKDAPRARRSGVAGVSSTVQEGAAA